MNYSQTPYTRQGQQVRIEIIAYDGSWWWFEIPDGAKLQAAMRRAFSNKQLHGPFKSKQAAEADFLGKKEK